MSEERFKTMWTILTQINHENLGDINSDMKCTICTRILIDAYSASCGCRYCLKCVEAYLNGESRFCPGNMEDCQIEALDIDKNMHPDLTINYRISKLTVECQYLCGVRCELRKMEEHQMACGKQAANSTRTKENCTDKQVVNDGINEHLVAEICSYAKLLVACTDKLQGGLALKRDVGQVRPEMAEMTLTNEIDKAWAKRTNERMDQIEQEVANLRNENKVVKEQNECLNEEIQRYQAGNVALGGVYEQRISELQARVEVQARGMELLHELERQMREEKEELGRNIDSVRGELTRAHQELEKRLQQVEANVVMQDQGQFVWRIGGWAAKVESARTGNSTMIYSEVFYSHENAYRMCLSVCPYGYGSGKGTHLAVFFHLMKGPFDEILSWPFKRAVTLSLIDQRTGGDHVSYTITHDCLPNHVNWNKPTYRNAEIGTPILLELAALSIRPGLCQDDTISIRCVVKSVTNL